MDFFEEYLNYLKAIERKKRQRARIVPIVLFIATVFTTLTAGAMMQFISPGELLRNPWLIFRGAPFAFPLLFILLSHEMGHYLAGKYHKVHSTLPYFIPFPNYIGTFGAVIRMKSPMRDRKALLDIGAAGPIAGFVLSVIACAWGAGNMAAIPLSEIPPASYWNPRIAFGSNMAVSLIFKMLNVELQPGYVYFNPIFDAGWLGLFVTSLNLLPAGQLDGGHIAYALLGERGARWLARFTVAALLVVGIPLYLFTGYFWVGWSAWGLLIMIIGLNHPPPMNPHLKLDLKRKTVGILCAGIFILTFTPTPFYIIP